MRKVHIGKYISAALAVIGVVPFFVPAITSWEIRVIIALGILLIALLCFIVASYITHKKSNSDLALRHEKLSYQFDERGDILRMYKDLILNLDTIAYSDERKPTKQKMLYEAYRENVPALKKFEGERNNGG